MFTAFAEPAFDVLRTIGADEVMVQEWRFSGLLTGGLGGVARLLMLRFPRQATVDEYAAMAERAPVVAAALRGISAAALLSRKTR